MSLIDLFQKHGIELVKVASTNGGEYAGPCVWCGGNDRCRVWPESDRWWCRGCGKSGDSIQFVMDLNGMTYPEACLYLGIQPKMKNENTNHNHQRKWKPKPTKDLSVGIWENKSRSLVDWSTKQLWKTKPGRIVLDWLISERGLTQETIKTFQLGWNTSDIYREREQWGLKPEINKTTGKPKNVWIPAGLIIPHMVQEKVVRVRIRRSNPGGGDRYILLPGSDTRPMLIGDFKSTLVVLESELDGFLVHQEAVDFAGVVALGNAQIKPDMETDNLLRAADLILCCLDCDEAGAKQSWNFWRDQYQAKRWPCIRGKDPAEMFQAGVDVKTWLNAGIPTSKAKPKAESRLAEIIRLFDANTETLSRYHELSEEGSRLIKALSQDRVAEIFKTA